MDEDTEARLLRRVHDMEERQLKMSRDIDMLNLTMTKLLLIVGMANGRRDDDQQMVRLRELAKHMEQLIKG